MTHTFRLLPRELSQEIEEALRNHEHGTLQVYAEAEKIRRRHLDLNIALEDILNRMVEDSGKYHIAVAFDPAEATHALMNSGDPEARMLQ